MDYNLTKSQAKELVSSKLLHFFGVSPQDATNDQFYKAVSLTVKDMLERRVTEFKEEANQTNSKKIYYLSIEFLMGRSLKNNLYNLNLTETFKKALADFDIKLDNLFECEPDAGLGNGGLGRLAACYLDGLATGGYYGTGYSLLYECGIFKQKVIDGWQTELPDFWLPGGEVWLSRREKDAVDVNFGGDVIDIWEDGNHSVAYQNNMVIKAVPYDMLVSGKDGKGISTLRLWKSEAQSLDMSLFDQGQHIKAMEAAATADVICKILYPSDSHPEGKSLRLKQQYFLVSASVQDIVKRHLRTGNGIANFAEKNAIHVNDTHPTMAIPEMMRVLLDECGYGWEESWDKVSNAFAYTNHTVMKEALECWSEDMFRILLPRIYQIIKEIDNRYREHIWNTTHNADIVEELAIVSAGAIRMANLCVACCHSVNGVSGLHSDILKEDLFHTSYTLTPEKFKNVTNGIAHRRWICQANPELTAYVTKLIGDGFIYHADELLKLMKFVDDKKVLDEIGKIKLTKKKQFAKVVKERQGIEIDPNSIFDVQVKRLHEYKRQHLNVFQIIAKYLEIKDNPKAEYVPHTYIFGAKAASGYFMAKKIISLIFALADLINNDKDVAGRLKIVFMEDYNVSLAEKLMPAADISEQISLAGTEASGTGNMKLMLNGALTLGTLDGANVEINESVGNENMILFGMTTPEVNEIKERGYTPMNYYNNNPELKRVVDFIAHGFNGKRFDEIAGIIHHDPYMVLADFADYREAQKKIDTLWANKNDWNKKALINIANAGRFACDRAIEDYARDIWHTEPVLKVK